MRFGKPTLWLSCGSAAVVLWLVTGSLRRTSPGPIANVHAQLKKLGKGESCSQCHGGWFETMKSACLECHADIGRQLQQSSGLHGALDADRAARCEHCHSEHNGEGFALVNKQSFARAGFASRDEFRHERIGYKMAGKHLELECKDCHANADIPVLEEGQKRFLGLDKNCASCHEDHHEGRYVMACADCHGQNDWTKLEPVGHDAHLPLVGAHGKLACADCHKEDTPHALSAIGRGNTPKARSCRDCHESPHKETFVIANARLAKKPAGSACVTCHVAEHTSFREPGLEITKSQHALSGFAIDAQHSNVACASCHDPKQESFKARYSGRAQKDCAACHEDPHGGQFAAPHPKSGSAAKQGCVGCHSDKHFDPHAFGIEQHKHARLPLEGRHQSADCNSCHQRDSAGQPRTFRGTPTSCEKCHSDAHRGFFDDKSIAANEHGRCAHCHTSESFNDRKPKGFDHELHAGFALKGAHLEATCEQCHPASRTADASGRRFGRVSDHFGKFEGCVTCHKDPHGGVFDRPTLPQRVEGRKGCARCHDETSFRALRDGFDHGQWTGFALTGRHAKLGCASCHQPLSKPTPEGRHSKRAPGSRCADCHADPHVGQFKVSHNNDCSKCHRSSTSFLSLRFNHELDARFRLGQAHSKVACIQCHKLERTKTESGMVDFVRYRPLPRKCSECHGTQDGPFKRGRRRRR